MADTISNLHLALYDQYKTNLSQGNRRSAEEDKQNLLKSVLQTVEWCLAAIEGSSPRQAAALTELGVIYTNTITPPTNTITSVETELNTRKGVGVSVVAGENNVSFPSAYEAGYALSITPYGSNGQFIQYSQDPDDRLASGFKIYMASAGKIDYLAYK